MPERLLDRRLKLGTYLGIGLYVHWTFWLLVAFVGWRSLSGGLPAVSFAIAQLLGVFVCVTLHEYGHAMAARQFGIGTADITLLPIGGIARLRRMPRVPWQELVVAVAGPAVNVAIVILLLLGFLLLTDMSVIRALWPTNDAQAIIEALASPSLIGFAVLMLIVNTMLVLFNMIPAFPMDGGRVFRSLLAMVMDYRRATTIASRVGLFCAALMALVALSVDPPQLMPVFIALFIGYAGIAEARQVNVVESVRGVTVDQVMVHSEQSISMDTRLPEIVAFWQRHSAPAVPVVSIIGTVVGMLQLSDVKSAIDSDADPSTTAGQLIDYTRSSGTVAVGESLENALLRSGRQQRHLAVVDAAGRLMGIVDLDSILVRTDLARYLEQFGSQPSAAAPIDVREIGFEDTQGRFNRLT